MKRIVFSLIAAFFMLANVNTAKASHVLGGEITWVCTGTPGQSQYIFFMTLYRDCTGATWGYNNENLLIFGNPLPRDVASNSVISSITLKPDSTKWRNLNNGDMSPICDPTGAQPSNSCSGGDPGSVQAFYYESDPINMKGTPPASGWRFQWDNNVCCRPNVRNLSGGASGTMTLRAMMYPDNQGSSVQGCLDNAPEFRSLPVSSICKGYLFTYNHTAVDKDLDSLVYAWDRTYDMPAANPTPRAYEAGFNFNNPTPGPAFNANNVAATLDPITGVERMAVYSGGAADKYLTVVRVDAYRDNKRIASVFREIPIVFFDCPDLEQGPGGLGGGPNSPPQIFIDGKSAENYIVNVVAGQPVSVPFQASDYDYAGTTSPTGLQTVSVVPDGFMFSNDFIDSTNCTQGARPCAILRNQSPILNSNLNPPAEAISALGVVSTEFVWQPQCKHLKVPETGIPGTYEGIFNFVMRTSDNFCPIPGINYPTITVRVKDPVSLTEPILKGASVDLDGRIIMQWAPPIDSAETFTKYRLEFAAVNDGNPPGAWLNGTNINVYKHKRNLIPNFSGVFMTNPDNSPNILNKRAGKDWYYQMATTSGCSGNYETGMSEPVQLMEVEATPSGVLPQPVRSKVTLNWNRPKPMFSDTYPYFIYESRTKFYIWENDSIEQSGVYIGGEADPDNWYLRGSTYSTNFDVESNTCNGKIGFRVEARDTIITYEQGSKIRAGQPIDTLIFSTFSVIDTVYMKNRGFIPNPQLDTIMVKENGEPYFRIDRANAGTVRSFKIFDHNNSSNLKNEIASFNANVDSFLYTGVNVNNSVDSFLVQSFDRCDLSNTAFSDVYTTIKLDGGLLTPRCSAIYELRWNKPLGFPDGIRRYDVYLDSANTGFERVDQITNANTTVANIQVVAGVDYKFRVIAVSNSEAVNISEIENYSSPNDLRTFEVVPAPELVCSYVEDNGSVTLNFLKPERDSTNNGKSYKFYYRQVGAGSWQEFANSNNVIYGQDFEVTITGIDAISNQYEFMARTLSGCSGIEPSPDGNILKSIKVDPSFDANNPDKEVVLSWNEAGIPNNPDYRESKYTVYKAIGVDGTSPYFSADSFSVTSDNGLIDYSNGDICDKVNGYYVSNWFFETKDDSINNQPYCMSRSAYDTIRVSDQIDPPTQLIDFVTVNPQTNELEIYWSEKPSEDIDSIYIIDPTPDNPNQFGFIDTVSWYSNPQSVSIPISVMDVRDTSIWVAAQSVDGCGRVDGDHANFDFHRNMDLDAVWNQCDSTIDLNWTGYHYFNEGGDEVTYTVYVDSTTGDGNFREIYSSETTDTTYRHKVYTGDMNYRFYVKATNSDNTLASNSNVDGDSAYYQDEPLYGYLHYATVTPNKAVEIQMLKDTVIRQGGYSIYRGSQKDLRQMQRIDRVDADGIFKASTFKYTDFTARTDQMAYYYKIITENQCGGNVDTSNFGSSIHLTIDADNEALTNTLKWNEYTEWDSTVAYYNIYRGFNGGEPEDLIAVVAPTDEPMNVYVDDVYDNTNVKGRYCYKVEAVQGPINAEFKGLINSATSVSNEACATQKPLFYVPNAFAPDGVNKVFLPKGQFFDFSLYEMAIYNRWGEQIFITRDVTEGWDGTHNGEIVPLGSYVYTIRFKDADGKEHKRKGTVTVIR